MKMNAAGLALIKASEGLRLTAYRCPAGVLTIGYGHTGSDVEAGQKITKQQAEALLASDLVTFERTVGKCAVEADTSINQFSAMVSLAYNIGLKAFQSSSVLRLHRLGDHTRAADAFLMWNKGGGKVLPGLVTRRMKERELYLS
jgi:lysozyme